MEEDEEGEKDEKEEEGEGEGEEVVEVVTEAAVEMFLYVVM